MILLDYFEKAWDKYIELAPQAKKISHLLKCEGEEIVNDHIAYRTLNASFIDIYTLAQYFTEKGYEICGEYHFQQKKVDAIHLEHPQKLPKIFLSQLNYLELDSESVEICESIISQIQSSQNIENLLLSGRLWDLSYKDYQKLSTVSEYASWFAAHGFIPNHFTLSVNMLKRYDTMEKLLNFIKAHNYIINERGGAIKGSPDKFLEQASTMAEKRVTHFNDGSFEIPTCYYEFALRYDLSNGRLFEGFLTESADKIFESTYEQNE